MNKSSKKVFISYSWVIQDRVIELAERLLSNGIDVVLDVYDLKEGQDKYAFMEQSVTDTSIDKVLIICDKSYCEKADIRSGGVGDETDIISPEVDGQVKQEKFIPIAFEVDENGKAYIPQYLKSRIYIVGLSNILDGELCRRKPAQGPHRKVVGAAVMDGKLFCEVLEGVKAVGRIETLLILTVATLHLAVVSGRIGAN